MAPTAEWSGIIIGQVTRVCVEQATEESLLLVSGNSCCGCGSVPRSLALFTPCATQWEFYVLMSIPSAPGLLTPSSTARTLCKHHNNTTLHYNIKKSVQPDKRSGKKSIINHKISTDCRDAVYKASRRGVIIHHYIITNYRLLKENNQEQGDEIQPFVKQSHGYHSKLYLF